MADIPFDPFVAIGTVSRKKRHATKEDMEHEFPVLKEAYCWSRLSFGQATDLQDMICPVKLFPKDKRPECKHSSSCVRYNGRRSTKQEKK